MMQIRVENKGVGLHPGEVVVEIQTKEGAQQLAVDARSLSDEMLEIGWPVGQKDDYYLVELPRETFSGFWRVWVSKADAVRREDARVA